MDPIPSMDIVYDIPSKKKRNYLSLEKKVEVINYVRKNPGVSSRSLSEIFQCGKTQIAHILKEKESLLSMYESSASGKRVHVSKRVSEFAEVNIALYEWYSLACSKNIYPGGTQLTEKAKDIAKRLGKSDFKGSRGWLDKWKKRYNVKRLSINEDVRGETVDSWKERLPEIIQGYAKEDIWNMDEAGVFWQALPEHGFGQKWKQCEGDDLRMTVAFFVTAAGTKERPVLISKSENPVCLQKIDKTLLPVDYFSHKKAWMSGEIMKSVLTKLNHRLACNNRSIVLLLDNAGCHPKDLAKMFSNIKIFFLPAKTTSKLQPLGLGIIQNFKAHYRHLLLKYVFAKRDECDTVVTEMAKSVNLLIAIRWVAKAWSLVKPETISSCFKKAGIQDTTIDVVNCGFGKGSFLEAGERMEMQCLIEKTMPVGESCGLDEYLRGDDDLPVCVELDDSWENKFLEQLGKEGQDLNDNADEDIIEQDIKIHSFKEAIESLEQVQFFLESEGHVQEALDIGSVVDTVASIMITASR